LQGRAAVSRGGTLNNLWPAWRSEGLTDKVFTAPLCTSET